MPQTDEKSKVNRAVFGGQFEKPRKPVQSPIRRKLPTGRDLLEMIQEGQPKSAPTEYVSAVRNKVAENCEELLEVGARIRPLLDGEKQIGWIRGVHASERKQLKRWISDPDDFLFNLLCLATSYSPTEINEMTAPEVYGLIETIRKMTEYDMSLLPYLSAFSTTQMSENLWFSKGSALTRFENRVINMPDGKKMTIASPPDHVRLWASLCNYREQAKKRLDENWNALLIVRPQAGKSADPIVAELKGVARSLMTDAIDPWSRIVKAKISDLDDGWAHGGGNTVEELKREMEAMIRGDKHEKYFDALQRQMEAEEEKRLAELEALRKKRNPEGLVGVVKETTVVFTDKELRERQAALKLGRLPTDQQRENERQKRADHVVSRVQKLGKYHRQ